MTASRMLNSTAGTPISAATQASAGVRRTAHSAIRTTPVPMAPRNARPMVLPSENG